VWVLRWTGSVLELIFVDVKNKDSLSLLQKVTGSASANTLSCTAYEDQHVPWLTLLTHAHPSSPFLPSPPLTLLTRFVRLNRFASHFPFVFFSTSAMEFFSQAPDGSSQRASWRMT
jgi:hypothetical protein